MIVPIQSPPERPSMGITRSVGHNHNFAEETVTGSSKGFFPRSQATPMERALDGGRLALILPIDSATDMQICSITSQIGGKLMSIVTE
jgi:hypothetical protein